MFRWQTKKMKIINAWIVGGVSEQFVLELEDPDNPLKHRLVLVSMKPYRKIEENDFKPYDGIHPRHSGVSAPNWFLPLYGLEKIAGLYSEVLYFRVTLTQKAVLQKAAKDEGMNLSEYIRDAIFYNKKDIDL